MPAHPELESEQAYIDFAYECVEQTRAAAIAMTAIPEPGPGGTFQARYERDVMWERMSTRAAQLDFGDAPLCFGRIDVEAHRSFDGRVAWSDGPDSFYIGRTAVSDAHQNPVVVDWRAPVAEPFYRATGREPMGLSRRRHFVVRGRELLGLDDELFGSAAAALDEGHIQGHGALIAALDSARSGKLSDIVATIQGEQDEIIRAPMRGLLVVQGGPGTGKTVVALHRAAYLLYTHRFPLEDQGVLVIGPNRLFLNYIDQVLPSLGEAGAQIAVLGDLIPFAKVARRDPVDKAIVKGDVRMVKVLCRGLRDRERPLRETARIPFGVQNLRLSVEDSTEIIATARRRARSHNAGRKLVEDMVFQTLAASSRQPLSQEVVRDQLRGRADMRELLERMWPMLTPAEFLNDLFGSPALLRSAAKGVLNAEEISCLHREREPVADDIEWSFEDAPLLDEALDLLGTHPRRKGEDKPRTYGHIIVDEAQDLSPMELRSIRRRSLGGSMTIVGDMAQATAPWASSTWEGIVAQLPGKHPPRYEYLRTGYRLPGPIMEIASKVLAVAAPELEPPVSIRHVGDEPRRIDVLPSELSERLPQIVAEEIEAVGVGSVAVLAPDSLVSECEAALENAGTAFGRATRHGLDRQVTVVPVSLAKGLELDAVIVVEPSIILETEARGPQALFVALTRCTRRLTMICGHGLPDFMR